MARRHYVVTGEREGGIKVCTPQRESVTLQRLTSTVGGLNGAVGNKSASGRAKLSFAGGWRETLMDAYSVHQPEMMPLVWVEPTGAIGLVKRETLAEPCAPRRVTVERAAPIARDGKRGRKVQAWRAE